MYKSKKWIIGEADEDRVRQISETYKISPLTARIIYLRGFQSNDEIDKFIKKDKSCFYNPFLLTGMDKAVERINRALERGEKIAVYGDYDVDGITSTYIMYDYLKKRGARIIFYIPDRADEGYGMNNSAIKNLKDEQVELIITVDVGITAVSEIEYAKSLGIDVIVTDHHSYKDKIPECTAVINPKLPGKYPFDSLAGVGVAFKLVYAVSGCDDAVIEKYCDIAAIGTIADMVPLTDENRFITDRGIKLLNRTSNIGIKSLIDVSGLGGRELTSASVSFTIAPRLNAAGRIASASTSVRLLLEENPISAIRIANELDGENRLRQEEEHKILSEALEIIYRDKLYEDEFIIVSKENWHHGVIGIVSSRITEMFYKPSAVISINSDGTGKASGRSIKGFNLFNALSECSRHLEKFGGHELAAGFTVRADNIEKFRRDINAYAALQITEEIATPKLNIDAVISAENINLDMINDLKVLEPCGIGNKSPVFCILNAKIKDIRYQSNGKHAFITVSDGEKSIETPAFNLAETAKNFRTGDCISAAGSLGINNYRGISSPQFITRDLCLSKNFTITKLILSDVFSFINKHTDKGGNSLESGHFSPDFKLCRHSMSVVLVALKIFSELGIFDYKINSDTGTVTVSRGENYNRKNNLHDSKTYLLYNGK